MNHKLKRKSKDHKLRMDRKYLDLDLTPSQKTKTLNSLLRKRRKSHTKEFNRKIRMIRMIRALRVIRVIR